MFGRHFPTRWSACSGLPSVTACISPLGLCYCCSHYLSSRCVINSKAAHPVSILLTILSVEHEETFRCEEGGRESHFGFGVPDPGWLCQKGPRYSPERHPVLTKPRCLLHAQLHSSPCRPVASIICQNSPMEEIVRCLEIYLYPSWSLCFQC